jgi:predicted ATPase
MVAGESGVGKTTLVQKFCRSVREATVLVGACDPLSTPTPLGPLLDIADALGGELQQMLAELAPRQRVFSAFLAALGGGSRPWVVVFEDVHWADDATLDLLRSLARRMADRRVLLIATYREDEVGPRHPLRVVLSATATAGAVRRLQLRPLSLSAVAQLARGQGVDALELPVTGCCAGQGRSCSRSTE